MPNDLADLKSTLASARIARDNNALHQTILGLINSGLESGATLAELVTSVEDLIEQFANSGTITVVEHDTTFGPATFDLDIYVKSMTLFKDVGGNAAVNNITLNGTVEGVVGPVINTNYGSYRVFKGENGLFFQW